MDSKVLTAREGRWRCAKQVEVRAWDDTNASMGIPVAMVILNPQEVL